VSNNNTFGLNQQNSCPEYPTTGVSNTRPARCVCAAHDIIKITQIIAETTVFVV